MVFERKRPGPEPLLIIPDPAPEPTPQNSWLTYNDKDNRFHLRHPQEYEPESRGVDKILFKRFRTDGFDDLVELTYKSRPQGRPDAFFKNIVAGFSAKPGVELLGGVGEKLPAADWPNVSAHHMEAALTTDAGPGQPSSRRFIDAYVLQFARDVQIEVFANTLQDDPSTFRKQVREMLKTVALDGAKGK